MGRRKKFLKMRIVFDSCLFFNFMVTFVIGLNIQIHSFKNVTEKYSDDEFGIAMENVVTTSTEKFRGHTKRYRKLPLSFQNFDVNCSTNLDDLPAPASSNLETEYDENFVQVEKNCRFERIWTLSTRSNETRAVFQFLHLKSEISFYDFNGTLNLGCDGSTQQEVLDILGLNVPKMKAACFEEHIPVHLVVENDVTNFTCPGQYTRTFIATNNCTGESVRRNQTVILEPSHGTCVDGYCICNVPWSGVDCEEANEEVSTEELDVSDSSTTDDSTTTEMYSPTITTTTNRQELVKQSMANWFWSIGAVVIPAAILVIFSVIYYLVNEYMKPERDENQNSDSEKAESQNPNSLKRDAQYELKPFLQNNANRLS